ncbi:alpha-keto acid decarboxylase family protein [Nostocaceae cyanobacterium CENA369]|uniref:Alpha-keto-acid decarboxylase n=1 Tax=Dendronalium phyllosphericum CENA369 TaxID=1725256 RepID=A0A8J7IAJ6_9NOST|nr:thiamine pyrophosphate-binding protein [Dendronalium phyllosphericum]MBH8575367.1 alpha-keto acid decarboxylase family protein [Dendronalium phyllosphericum CENA369]
MSTQYTVNSYLLDRLKELGLGHIFGVPGDYAFPLLDCIEKNQDISWVGTCNELNASYAADGYARIRGIGAFLVTCGVGELSASCGVGGAYAEGVPVVAIAGHPATQALKKGLFTHHSLHGDFSVFPRIYKEFTVAQALLTPENACQEIDRVLEACWLEKLPVYIQLPRDVGGLPAEAPTQKLALSEPVSDPTQLAALLSSLLPLLSAAQCPAMLIDSPVGSNQLTKLVESFANKSGIPFAATFTGKSALLDQTHPQYLGMYQAGMEGAVNQLIESADLLLRLGIQHDETNTGCAAFDLQSPHVVDLQIKSAAIAGSNYPNVTLHDVLIELSQQVPHREFAFSSQQARTNSVPFEPQHNTPIKQDRLWQRFGDFLESDDVVVVELGTCTVGATGVTMPARTRIVTQYTWEAIGYTLPAVLGAHLADQSRRHLLVVGDGAFQLTAQELSTILRHELNPIIFLLHNNNYQVENAMRVDGKQMHYNEVQSWNYHQLATIFTQKQKPLGLWVSTESELETALTQAHQAQTEGRCVLIEVMLAPKDIPSQLAKSLNLLEQQQK